VLRLVDIDLKKNIMQDIYENRMLLTSTRDKPEGWTLHSGLWSPFYIQLRILSSFPDTLNLVGKALGILVKEEAPHINRLVGIAFAGIPIATAASEPNRNFRKLSANMDNTPFLRVRSEMGMLSALLTILLLEWRANWWLGVR
jgi:orotate phosphoribosyltransferase